ncbi:MAG: type IIA DNA topoisomerase subunit B, partial [Alphaproteobacteria bacterium]|nr:type IIA DNA topoisomerase subunit B [Alphaproteobacteria bacterium]
MSDLFQQTAQKTTGYDAKDIEVLEGLEPVRCRPGMYIGGTDERALHHLASELLDNSMDEAIAGHASLIEVELFENGSLMVKDNGRGIPVDPHPKFPEKSALEVILTTLHSGGKFGGNAYSVSGGLHGVGLSVVNALSESLTIEVARDKTLWSQSYSRGIPLTSLVKVGNVNNRRGTMISFVPDDEIFGSSEFSPAYLYRMARSKAYLHKGVKIKWTCASSLMKGSETIPENTELSFPNGLKDFLEEVMRGREVITEKPFTGEAKLADNQGHIEWAATWPERSSDGFLYSYCNTIPTPQGGTHENGFKTALYKGLRAYAELIGNKKAGSINADDVIGGAGLVLSLFIKNPLFQGQTKEKLSNPEATRLVETAIRDHFDHWLTRNPDRANSLLEYAVDNAEERLSRRRSKEMSRKSATKRLRLPGKLTDCTRSTAIGAELFIVEGDSAGGSAKQARNRLTQAILPLRGKILNVASATAEKIRNNSEISDIIEALGCGTRDNYDEESLRYEKVIIMTDADV